MKKLAEKFVPAADEVGRLQRATDPESRLFQGIMELGHYGGRFQPTDTRQGTYMLTPSGKFLASVNTNDPQAMLATLRKALEAWNQMPKSERVSGESQPDKVGRFEEKYPENGLVVRVVTRDLPREGLPADWRARAWNVDYAWFRQTETQSLIPTDARREAVGTLTPAAFNRLARLHIVDNVRGQTPPYAADTPITGALRSKISTVTDRQLELRLEGSIQLEEKGVWSTKGYEDMRTPSPNRRGVKLQMKGEATWDRQTQRFTRFELVMAGDRWGATQYNERHDDLGPAPIGFLLTLTTGSPSERVAPANWWAYGW